MVDRRCPYESDLRWVIWSFPFKMNGIDEKWMNRGRIIEMRWNEWFEGSELEQPYGKVPISRLRVSLSKWLEMSDLIKPYQNDQNRWEMNELSEMKWIEVKWSDLMDLTWMNPMGISLWSIESVPIRVTWDEWFDQTLSKWSESMRFEWIEVNRTIWGEMSELKDLTLWTLWESPYGQKKVSLSKWLEWTLWESPYQNEWIQWDLNELKWIEWNEVKWVKW